MRGYPQFAVLFGFLVLVVVGWAGAQQPFGAPLPLNNLAPLQPPRGDPVRGLAVNDLVQQLESAITDHAAKAGPFRIAVFAPGNGAGELSRDAIGAALEFRASLNSRLRDLLGRGEKTRGKFSLLGDFAVQDALKKHNVDAADIHFGNSQLSQIAKQLEIHALILGEFNDRRDQVSLKLFFASNGGPPAVVQVRPGDSEFSTDYCLNSQQRIGVSLQCRAKEDSPWEEIPVVQDREAFDGPMYAVISPERLRERYEYRVLVRNTTFVTNKFEYYLGGIANRDSDLERRRIFAAAVLIDGLNSIYGDVGSGERDAVAVHPRDAAKWLIGPPGYTIRADDNGTPLLTSVRGEDHSTIAVLGFQDGANLARAFTFQERRLGGGQGPSDAAIPAARLNLSDSLGLISVFIFSQKLLNDQSITVQPASSTALGTAAGRPFAHPVLQVNVDLHPQPVAQFHFYYRLEKDIPIPRKNWKAVCGTQLPKG